MQTLVLQIVGESFHNQGLLVVLFAKICGAIAGRRKQLLDDGGDSVEVTWPMVTFKAVSKGSGRTLRDIFRSS